MLAYNADSLRRPLRYSTGHCSALELCHPSKKSWPDLMTLVHNLNTLYFSPLVTITEY